MAKILNLAPPLETLSWSDLVQLEPTLGTLERQARAVRADDPWFCANDVWFREFKPLLVKLVGWNARSPHEVMHRSEAYDIAYRHIYDQLPPCGDCWCL